MTDEIPIRVSPELEREFPGADRRANAAVVNLLRTNSLVYGELAGYLRRYDLTPATFNVLMVLRGAQGRLCPHEIGDRLLVTRGTVTGLLDSLERRALIRRIPNEEDRRMLGIEITPKALKLLTKLLPGHFAGEKEMLSGLSVNEKETLVRLLAKIQAHLSVD